MTDDFVRRITDRLKKDADDARLKSQRTLQKAKTIESHAPEQWYALRDWVHEFCENANREMDDKPFTFHDTPSSQLKVNAKTARGDRTLQAGFNQQTNEINFTRSRFTPSEEMNTFSFMNGSVKVSVEQMGEIFIETLLDKT
jgi:hypothetical protein